MSGILLEDLCMFYCCQRHKYAIKLLLCNTQYCCIVDSDMYLNNTHKVFLGFYCNHGYVNAPQYYVICTLSF